MEKIRLTLDFILRDVIFSLNLHSPQTKKILFVALVLVMTTMPFNETHSANTRLILYRRKRD